MAQSVASEFTHNNSNGAIFLHSTSAVCLSVVIFTMATLQSVAAETSGTTQPEPTVEVSPIANAADDVDQDKKQKTRCMPKKPCPDTRGDQP
jgi:hypothetical protein